MNQLSRAVMQSSRLLQSARQTERLQPTLFALSPKLFSTEAAPAAPKSSSNLDHILQSPSSGSVYYGKLTNIGRYTSKAGVMNLLEGCDLNPANLKVEYARNHSPLSMLIEFPSRSAYDAAQKAIAKGGHVYMLSRTDKARWDAITPYDGKVILLAGMPRTAQQDDVERFLSGCQYDSSSVQLFLKNEGTVKGAFVRFPSQRLATHAYLTKNGGFLLNSKIFVHLLH